MKKNNSVWGVFEANASYDFRTINDHQYLRCLAYYKNQEDAGTVIHDINIRYRNNTFSNVYYKHRTYTTEPTSEYQNTVIRRYIKGYYPVFGFIEIPSVSSQVPFDNDHLLIENRSLDIAEKYNGNYGVIFEVYFNKVKNAYDKSFHIRQYLVMHEIDDIDNLISDPREIYNGAPWFEPLRVNNLDTEKYYAEAFIDLNESMKNTSYRINPMEFDKEKRDKLNYFFTVDSGDFNVSTIYAYAGYVRFPNISNELDTAHIKVEEEIIKVLRNTENQVYSLYREDLSKIKNKKEYMFEKVIFDENAKKNKSRFEIPFAYDYF